MKVLWIFVLIIVKNAHFRSPALTAKDLIKGKGYPYEEYNNIITEDNYILTVYRIPHGKTNLNKTSQSVILMHGLMGTAVDFLRLGPGKGLGYILADRNYDVWLPNTRGSIFSRGHVKYNPDLHSDYWKFSWHEIGMYDLPAIINLVTNVTKKEETIYIGMSQGTTVSYVLLSDRPNFNEKIKCMISLAPVAYMKNTYSPIIRFFALYEPIWTNLSNFLGLQRLPPKFLSDLTVWATHTLCTQGWFAPICKTVVLSIIFLTGGVNIQEVDRETLTTLAVSPYIDGSVRQLLHYAQNINSGEFRHYNYGPKTNMKLYGQRTPLKYNLSKISTPTYLFYGDNDWFADKKDVQHLCSEIENCKSIYRVPQKKFSHYDFIFGKDAATLVYDKVLEILKQNQ